MTFNFTPEDKQCLRTVQLHEFAAIPIQEQEVKADLVQIIINADENAQVLMTDDVPHYISKELEG